MQVLPAGWRLWHPFAPSRPEAVLRDLGHVRPGTVVWLNEIQHYLLTATKTLGEHVAAGLHSLMHDPERTPVLVIGTAWPEHWAALTPSPQENETDHHPHARALLTATGTTLVVPDRFSEADLRSLQTAAFNDPRLAYAAEHAEQGHITQYLAGAPALIDRYRTSPPGAKALIEAAMDARCLGHGPALPLTLLEAAADGYLTDHQRNLLSDDWLERALAYVAAPLRGIRGALTPIRPGKAHPTFAHPHYLLADYLEKHGRIVRGITPAPASLWTALTDHASRTDLPAFARSASDRGLMRLAVQLWTAAADADAGDSTARLRVAETLVEAGRPEEALPWLQRACELYSNTPQASDPWLLNWVRSRLVQAGYPEVPGVDDTTWRKSVAANGSEWVLSATVDQLRDQQGLEEALAWLRAAAERGNPSATRKAVEMLIKAGRDSEALGWFQRAAASGRPETAYEACLAAAAVLKEEGRIDEALTWCQRAAEGGQPICAYQAAREAAEMLAEEGRIDEALSWFQRAATTRGLPDRRSSSHAAMAAVFMLQEAGRTGDLPIWLWKRAEGGDVLTMITFVLMLEAGTSDELLAWLRNRAERGDPLAMYALAHGGPAEDAEFWSSRALAYFQSVEGAHDWHQRLKGLDPDSSWDELAALNMAVEILEDSDRAEEADVWIRDRAESGDPAAAKILASRLWKAGSIAKALAWYQHAAETGDHSVVTYIADILGEMGRTEEAIAWYRRTAERKYHLLATDKIASLLEKGGRLQDAGRFKRYGLEPDGSLATPWETPPPR
ncbi:hypothetical protein AS594_35715 [Streptomyces agglomeratus]|uniref:Sel1 repeat family protein n=1 Tax=Streptomyces agglomeratus TaxID=285458 RepID=A0A1E5PHP1_9ACTN|nr:hypothetical protein AS594_35715 [Streptomyces agglomeratus]